MASRDELRQLRAEARKRHRAATNKISRMKSSSGVRVSGSKFDPRVPRGNINRYTEKQLRSYIGRMNDFMSRGNQYVPDASRRPMRSSIWNRYRNYEKQYNRNIDQRFSQYKDVFMPSAGMTVGERMEMMTPRFQYMQDRAVNTPYTPVNRRSTNIGSERALKRLAADMKNRVTDQAYDREIKAGREQYRKMSEFLDNPALDKIISNLSQKQFDVLWNYTAFANATSLGYSIAQDLLSDQEKPWHSDVKQTAMSSAYDLAQWASTLDLGK